jgi:hypothetical protein
MGSVTTPQGDPCTPFTRHATRGAACASAHSVLRSRTRGRPRFIGVFERFPGACPGVDELRTVPAARARRARSRSASQRVRIRHGIRHDVRPANDEHLLTFCRRRGVVLALSLARSKAGRPTSSRAEGGRRWETGPRDGFRWIGELRQHRSRNGPKYVIHARAAGNSQSIDLVEVGGSVVLVAVGEFVLLPARLQLSAASAETSDTRRSD